MKSKRNNAIGPQIHTKKKVAKKGVLASLAGVTIVGSVQVATQVFADAFNYQEVLGQSFHNIYAPWSIITWAGDWYHVYPDMFIRAGSAGMLTMAAGLVGLAFFKTVASNTSRASEYLHGSARWADRKTIEEAGLLPKTRTAIEVVTGAEMSRFEGVYVGGWEDNGKFYYLRHNGPEHVLTYAPTRSGKGVGLVVTTLLSWPSSCVITDLKGELWALTSGWRKQHAKNRVLKFEPASTTGSIDWNVLDEIRIGTDYEVGDVQNLATLIVDPDGKGLISHWQKTSFSLLVGVILHALYKAKNEGDTTSLPKIDLMMADPDKDSGELWMEMATYKHVDGVNHSAVGSAGRDMMDRPDDERGSVLSTAKSYLSLYRDPVVAGNISSSGFRIKDLMNHDDPVSLYIVTQPNDKARLRPLVRILINMIIRLLADDMSFVNGRPVANYKHRLLAMLDEFPSLGKLDIVAESLAFVAGYGIKCYLICQDLNQLKSRDSYGPDETITSNCHVQNAYPPNRIETADHLSRLTGQTTVVKEQITTSGRRTAAMMGQVSRTMQEVQRPLLTPDECLRMPGPIKNGSGEIVSAGDMVIYVSGYPAIYGKQPLYFKDPVFAARASIQAPKVSDRTLDSQVIGDDSPVVEVEWES